jgi:hypothetical protein
MALGGEYIREWARQKVEIPARIEILLPSGCVFTDGRAMIRDISFKGARIGRIVLRRPILPARPFRIRLTFESKEHSGVGAICKPVRFGTGDEFELGVEFEEFWASEGD